MKNIRRKIKQSSLVKLMNICEKVRQEQGFVPALKSFLKSEHFLACLLSLIFTGLAFCSFPGSEHYLLLLYPPLAFMLSISLYRILEARREQREEREFSYFLSYLAGQVNMGRNIELSLAEAYHELRHELNSQGRIALALSELSVSLYAGIGLKQALENFASKFRQKSIQRFCAILSQLLQLGGKYEVYLNLARDNLFKSLELEAELKSQNSASFTEAVIMSILPFILSFLMNKSNYAREISNFTAHPSIQAILLLLASCTFVLGFKMLRESLNSPIIPKFKIAKTQENKFSLLLQKLCQTILNLYPENLRLDLEQVLHYFFPHTQNLWLAYNLHKFAFAVLASIPFTFLSDILFFPLFFLLFAALQDARLYEAKKTIRQAELCEYPDFLILLAILLDSYLTLEHSLRLTLLCFNPSQESNLLAFDLACLKQDLQSGLSPEEAIYRIAAKRQNAEIGQCLYLIHRYAQEGSAEQLQSISLLSLRTQDSYRNAMREKLGKKGLKVLLPITFDLLLVIAIVALPAVLQLKI